MPIVYGEHNNKRVYMQVVILPADKEPANWDNLKPYKALVDTGAVDTHISTKIVEELCLEQCSVKTLQNSHTDGVIEMAVYSVRIGILTNALVKHARILNPHGDVNYTEHAAIPHKAFNVADLGNPDHFDVLLGMDFLSQGSLRIEGDGTSSFAF